MPGQKAAEDPLSFTDSLIKDLEDPNRLDAGLYAVSVRSSGGQGTVSQGSFE